MAKKSGSITFNKITRKTEAAILAAYTSRSTSPRVVKDMQKRIESKYLAYVEEEATKHYRNVLSELDAIIQRGVPGAEHYLPNLQVSTPDGASVSALIAWKQLAPSTLARKEGTGTAKRSVGAGKFWLDRGQLRRAFRRIGSAQVKVTARIVRVRGVAGGFAFDVALELSRLPRTFLNDAIRRALIEGLNGVDSPNLSTMAGVPEGAPPLRGLSRGFWAEARRPLMRPVSRRLGKAMRTSVIQSFKRRR